METGRPRQHAHMTEYVELGSSNDAPAQPSPRARQRFYTALAALGATILTIAVIEMSLHTPSSTASSNASAVVSSHPVVATDTATAAPETKTRLTIVNGCEHEPLWIVGFAVATPVLDAATKLPAGGSINIPIPDKGLSSTRFWAKYGCDATGQGCKIGQSGGPGESCAAPAGCAPPVDSKFEASFGCLEHVPAEECAVNPSLPSERLGRDDWWDVSQVDGWTLPYKVEVGGGCGGAPSLIDCSKLALSSCPNAENLGVGYGTQPLTVHSPEGAGDVVGCYSPCGKLTYSQWGQGYANSPESDAAQDYCCPTPPIKPGQCSSGPVVKTAYVKAVHSLCPSVYAYAYDDGVGLSQCPAGTSYTVTFYCPS